MEKTIAVIDDSRTIRAIIRKSVLAAGVKVKGFHEAENGADGISVIKMNRDHLSLIIMDINMPKMDGVEMLQALRKEGISGIPILVISSHADTDMQATCKALGARAFVSKPFTHESFRAALELTMAGSTTGNTAGNTAGTAART
jgi:two-component system, chemotaxis family, chemotaxis protein CheY